MKYPKYFVFQNIIFLIASLIFSFGCEKNETKISPTIQIISPTQNTSYVSTDTIKLEANIKDDKLIKSVNIRCLNKSLLPVKHFGTFQPEKCSYSFRMDIVISEIQKISNEAEFYIEVSASNGELQSKELVLFNILGKDARLLHILLFCKNNLGNTNLYCLDTNNILTLKTTFNSDYRYSLYSKPLQLLIFNSYLNGNLYCINAKNGNLHWNRLGESIYNFPGFTSTYILGNQIYAAHYDKCVFIYNLYGNSVTTIPTESNGVPILLTIIGNEIVVVEQTPNRTWINTYFLVGCSYKQGIDIAAEINYIYSLNNKEVLFFCTIANELFVKTYNLEHNTIKSIRQLSGNKFNDICAIDDSTFIFANNLGLYQYYQKQNSVIPITTSVTFQKIQFNKSQQLLYACNNRELKVFKIAPFTFVSSVCLQDSILNFHPVFTE